MNGQEGAPNGWGGAGLFTCWVAMDDVGPTAGPLQFIKGSHRWGVRYPDKGTERQDPLTQQEEIEALRSSQGDWEAVENILPKGGASFGLRSFNFGGQILINEMSWWANFT